MNKWSISIMLVICLIVGLGVLSYISNKDDSTVPYPVQIEVNGEKKTVSPDIVEILTKKNQPEINPDFSFEDKANYEITYNGEQYKIFKIKDGGIVYHKSKEQVIHYKIEEYELSKFKWLNE